MRGTLSRLCFVLTALFFMLFAASGASADTIPITGTASLIGDVTASIGINSSSPGQTAQIVSGTPDWDSPVWSYIQGERVGQLVNFSITVPTPLQGFGPGGCLVETCASVINGVSANILGGGLTFSGMIYIPEQFQPNSPHNVEELTVPVTVSGELIGYEISNVPFWDGSSGEVWDVTISGIGTAQFDESGLSLGEGGISLGYIQDIDFNFAGALSGAPAPAAEPSTMAMLGTGLLFFGCGALILRRRRVLAFVQ